MLVFLSCNKVGVYRLVVFNNWNNVVDVSIVCVYVVFDSKYGFIWVVLVREFMMKLYLYCICFDVMVWFGIDDF